MGICEIADAIKHCTIEPSINPLPARFFRTLHRSHIGKGFSNIYTFVFPFDDLIISFYVSSRNRFKGNYTVTLITYWGKIESVITDSLIIIPTESSKAAALALRTAAIKIFRCNLCRIAHKCRRLTFLNYRSHTFLSEIFSFLSRYRKNPL